MRAKDVLSPRLPETPLLPMKSVDSEMPLLEVLPHLLDAPGRMLGVEDNDGKLGVIDGVSLLEGLGRLIAPRDDSAVITIECDPANYSASAIARAVEDVDVHLVDLISHPAEDGSIHVTLRLRSLDPTAAIRSLERYGYRTVEATAASDSDASILSERLASLQALLNV